MNEQEKRPDRPDFKEIGKTVSYFPGDVIYETEFLVGDPSAFLILDGKVDVIKKYTPLQKEVFHFEKGDVFGVLEIYTGTPRMTQAVAVTEVKAIGYSKAELEKAMVGNLNFAIQSIRSLSRMLRQINHKIKSLT